MIRVIMPRNRPHHLPYHYTRAGVWHRVFPRLLNEGVVSRCELSRLAAIYFGDKYAEYQDDVGVFRNVRKCRLYRLSRLMHYDRKERQFSLIRRSGMFYVYVDDDGRVLGFVSPCVYRKRGIICSV